MNSKLVHITFPDPFAAALFYGMAQILDISVVVANPEKATSVVIDETDERFETLARDFEEKKMVIPKVMKGVLLHTLDQYRQEQADRRGKPDSSGKTMN